MIEFNNREHGLAIAKSARLILHPEDIVISRVTSEGNLAGGVVFNNYTGASIEVHVAGFSPNWLCREFLWVVFDYAFNQLKVSKTFGLVSSKNQRALAFDYKLGFKYVTTVPGYFRDGNLVIVDMDRETCRWLAYEPRTLQGASNG